MAGPASLWAFSGTWSLKRDIRHLEGATDRFIGTAHFHASGSRLVQDEAGWLETGGTRFQATRRYIWGEKNGRLEVFFDDMRPFHTIPLGAEAPETVHLCPPDRYQVAYDFAEWPLWRTVWRVEGPRKQYEMESIYRPHAATGSLASVEAAVHKADND